MADPFDVLSWDDHPLGPGTGLDVWFAAEDTYAVVGELSETARRGTWSLIQSTRRRGRTLTLQVAYNAADEAMTDAEFHSAVPGWFNTDDNDDGERYLTLYAPDAATIWRLGCYVLGWSLQGDAGLPYYTVGLYAPNPAYETAAAQTLASPAVVANHGNASAYPTCQLTSATHVTWKHYTVAGNGVGSGFYQLPVRFAVADAACTSGNCYTFVNGKSVPNSVVNGGSGTSAVYVLVSVGTGLTTVVDIVYGPGLSNPLANILDMGGMDFNAATFTNALWWFNNWISSDNPLRAGAWRLGRTGRHNAAVDLSYGVSSESGSGIAFAIGAPGVYANDADSIVMDLGGDAAGASNALSGLTRTLASFDGTNARAFCRYQVAGSDTWVDAWTDRTNHAVTADIDIPLAVRVAVGIENDGATLDAATVTLSSGVSGTSLAIHASYDPTITLVSTRDMDLYDGTLTFGTGPQLVFVNYAVPDGTLVIDAKARTIESGDKGPPVGSFTFSDDVDWLALAPGTNAVTNSTGGTLTVVHRHAYS